jgi:hypothetical protein
VAVHVLFGKLDADGEYANSDNDASKLEGNIICILIDIISPRAGVEEVRSVGS